ncbi:DUF2752 domain-containing protein [Anatilimnocola floriformis]|uniref:DUF2752 domain-containing protein n=1 Tax=Anatilimnocola floriformis TaxID=2948575 RepID=UPI0020C3596D|nr:DUF2752 domain-containing protein [Anatilimnocola floriformis]
MSAAVPESEIAAAEFVVAPIPYDTFEAKQRRDLQLHVFLLISSAAVVALAATMTIHEAKEVRLPGLAVSLPELCYFRAGTGIDCPGCGLTRSFIAFAHGRLLRSWLYNPAGALFFPVVVFQIPYRAAQLLRIRRGLPSWNLGNVAYGMFAGLLLTLFVQWVAKFLS